MFTTLAGFIFWNPIATSALEFYIHRYCRNCLNAELLYEQIIKKDRSIVFVKPILKTTNKRQLSADEVVVEYDLSPFSIKLNLNLKIDHPHLNLKIEKLFSFNFREIEKQHTFEIEGSHVSGDLILQAAQAIWPSLSDWNVSAGDLSGKLAYADNGKSSSLLGNVTGRQIAINNPSLQLSGHIPHANLHFDPADRISAFASRFELKENASLSLFHGGRVINQIQGSGSFQSDKGADLSFNGVLCHSNCSIPVHVWSLPSSLPTSSLLENVHIQLKGKGHHFAGIAPEGLQRWIGNSLSENEIVISGQAFKIDSGIHLEGDCQVCDLKANNKHSFGFGVDLKPAEEHLEWASLSHWQGEDNETAIILLPVQMLRKQIAEIGLALENGQIQGKNIPLDLFTETLAIGDGQLILKGAGDFNGSFDHRNISFEYTLYDLILDHPNFTLYNSTEGSIGSDDLNKDSKATHTLDLNSGDYFGKIPLSNITILEKNNGVKFTNISAHLILEPNKIQSTDLEAFCNDIYFSGTLNANYDRLSEGYATIDIHAHTMEGPVTKVQEVLSRVYTSPFLLNCPLQGNLSFRQQGGRFQFNIEPTETHIQANLQGSLTDGNLSCPNSDMSLRDLSFNFEYDHQNNSLKFVDIQGSLLVGSPKHAEEYVLAGDHLRFTDYANNFAEFDMWIGDKNRDIIRLIGNTKGMSLPHGNFVELTLNHTQSHFGDVHPDAFRLVLKDWTHVNAFELKLGFQLNTLLHDLQRFSKTGFLFLSRNLLKELNRLKVAQGEFFVDLQYDDATALFKYQVKGTDVSIGAYKFKNCFCDGKKKDLTWTIDRLLLDDLSIAADISSIPNGYRLNFLGLRFGKSLLMGLEGKYHPADDVLDAKINLFEVKLNELKEWPFLNSFVQKCTPKGSLRGTGHLRLAGFTEKPRMQVETDMSLSLHDWGFYGIGFQNADNIHGHYSSAKGISFHNVRTGLNNNQPLAFSVHPDSAVFDSGKLIIADQSSNELHVHWLDTKEGMDIEKIEGSLEGMTAHLSRSENGPPDALTLDGELIVNPSRSPLLEKLSLIKNWQLDGEYHLEGRWSIKKQDLRSWQDHLSFEGNLKGSTIKLCGYLFDSISGHISFLPEKVHLQDIRISDQAGSLVIDQVLFNKQQGQWVFDMPALIVKQFQPGLLRSAKGTYDFFDNSLVFRKMELREFKGYAENPLSYLGKGRIYVANPPKREKPNPAIQIPSEILIKLGLDLSALSPVAGAIDYKIENGKILLTKFKDMYSIGHLSKFYLPKKNFQPSYIDFKGNIHMKVRMKQYNLLFKLAELFTITVEGTLRHPKYSILKESQAPGK